MKAPAQCLAPRACSARCVVPFHRGLDLHRCSSHEAHQPAAVSPGGLLEMHSARPTLYLQSQNLNFKKSPGDPCAQFDLKHDLKHGSEMAQHRDFTAQPLNHLTIQGEQSILSPFYRQEN